MVTIALLIYRTCTGFNKCRHFFLVVVATENEVNSYT